MALSSEINSRSKIEKMRPSASLAREPGWLARGGPGTSASLLPRHRPRTGGAQPAPDELAFDEDLIRRAARVLGPLLRFYFRGEVRGLGHVPEGQTLIIANHDGGMLPVDAPLLLSEWYGRFGTGRRLHVLVHDMVLAMFGPFRSALRRVGCILADRHNLDAVLDAGHSLLIYPGGPRETFRTFFERKTLSLGLRTGFVRHALRRRVPITPVVSAGVHETLLVLWRGGWLADRLGITRRFRADVFPIVAGMPFGVWLGAGIPHFPLPAKVTLSVLPPIDLHGEVRERLGRELCERDLNDEGLVRRCFDRVRVAMQRELDRLYAERRFPIIG